MKRLFLLCLLALMLSPLAYSQAEKPNWAVNPVHCEGKTSKLITISEYGRTKESTKTRAFKSLEEGGRKLNEGYRIVEEYWEFNDDWAYGYFLVQVAKELKCTNWERVDVNTTKYPFSARCLVPGMAQIWKGSKAKGGSMIALEAIGVGGIVASFCMKGSYERLMEEDPKFKQEYSDKADMWQNIGYGCIAFTAAVYVWSFIDGAVAPGKKHIQIGSKSYEYALAPIASPRGDLGLAMQVKF
jgi:hypothetical protein